jgi:branched-chain amino acid transport system ATP-binding protein
MNTDAPLLEVTDIAYAYAGAQAVRRVSLRVGAGEIVALLGANGAGKTTSVKMIAGVLPPRTGSIRLQGRELAGAPSHAVVRQGVTLVPEGRLVFPQMTVLENLQLGAHIQPDRAVVADLIARAFTTFPRLAERRRQLAGSMSGGEQQMLAIGRALMSRPRLLLLDEPSLGLAPVIVQRIGAVITDIQRAEQLAVILAEQNSTWALKLARRGLVLEVGRVQLEGLAEDLRADDHVRRAYLGA